MDIVISAPAFIKKSSGNKEGRKTRKNKKASSSKEKKNR